jgi:hypothetical protein
VKAVRKQQGNIQKHFWNEDKPIKLRLSWKRSTRWDGDLEGLIVLTQVGKPDNVTSCCSSIRLDCSQYLERMAGLRVIVFNSTLTSFRICPNLKRFQLIDPLQVVSVQERFSGATTNSGFRVADTCSNHVTCQTGYHLGQAPKRR